MEDDVIYTFIRVETRYLSSYVPSMVCCRFCCGCPIPCRVTVNGMGGLGEKGGAGGAPEAEKIER